jgi:hypothetical protein
MQQQKNHSSARHISPTVLIAGLVFVVSVMFFVYDYAKADTITWTGAGGNTLWSNGANWSSGSPPAPIDTVVFNDSCLAYSNCNAELTGNTTAANITLASTYTGTITQGSYTLTVNGNYSQSGGEFLGGSGQITMQRLYLYSGSFRATNGTMYLGEKRVVHGHLSTNSLTITNGIFDHNNGTIEFWTGNTYGYRGYSATDTITVPMGTRFYAIRMDSDRGTHPHHGNAAHYFQISGAMTVEHSFIHAVGFIFGTVYLEGNLTISQGSEGSRYSESSSNIGTIHFVGEGDQYYTYTGGRSVYLRINKETGNVLPSSTSLQVDGITITKGHFVFPTGVAYLGVAASHGNHSVSPLVMTNGTLAHNGGTIHFMGYQYATWGSYWINNTVTVPTGTRLHNVIFDSYGSVTVTQHRFSISNKFVAEGNFTHGRGSLNGAVEIEGNVVIKSTANGGNAQLHFTGPNNQTYTNQGGNEPDGDITINKTGGKVTLASNAQWNASNQNVTITSGTLQTGNYTLQTRNLVLGASGALSQNGSGNVSLSGSLTNSGIYEQTGNGTLSVNGALTIQNGGVYRTSTDFSSSAYYTPTIPSGTLAGSPYRKRLGVRASQISETLTNFPVYVDLSDLGSDFFNNTNCTDIRVTTSNGTTEVPREIVSCSTVNGTGELHFLAPELSHTENTEFYIYYGSGQSDYAPTDTYGAQAVWEDYVFVSHDGGGTNSVTGIAGTTAGTITVGGDANPHMGSATTFNGTNAYIDYADSSAQRPTNLTLQTWLKNDGGDWNNPFEEPISKRTGNNFNGYMFFARNDLDFRVYASDNLDSQFAQSEPLDKNIWNFYSGVRGDDYLDLYINGAWVAEDTSLGTNGITYNGTQHPLRIGKKNNDAINGWFAGSLDEIRISPLARSAEWLATEYANQSNPSSFYVITDVDAGTTYLEGNEPLTAAALTVGGNVSVASGGLWEHKTYGTVTLGGNVTNDGTITFQRNTPSFCGGDYVNLTTSGGTALWSGSGEFNMHNLNLQNQAGTASIIAYRSLDADGNGDNWEFYDKCPPPPAAQVKAGTKIQLGGGARIKLF